VKKFCTHIKRDLDHCIGKFSPRFLFFAHACSINDFARRCKKSLFHRGYFDARIVA